MHAPDARFTLLRSPVPPRARMQSRIHFMGGDVRAVTEELFEEGKIPKELGGTYEARPTHGLHDG